MSRRVSEIVSIVPASGWTAIYWTEGRSGTDPTIRKERVPVWMLMEEWRCSAEWCSGDRCEYADEHRDFERKVVAGEVDEYAVHPSSEYDLLALVHDDDEPFDWLAVARARQAEQEENRRKRETAAS